jgi:hypothetical protein
MDRQLRRLMLALAVAALPAAGRAAVTAPPPECRAHVGYDRDADLPGYLLPDKAGGKVCVPFTVTAAQAPAGYRGDFHVDEFTDAKIAARWKDCQADAACRGPIDKHAEARKPPNREHGITDPHTLWLLARPADIETADLGDIRRPGFFGAAPWRERIAEAEPRTDIVEFSVEPEPYERKVLGARAPVKLRGWYLRGRGLPAAHGQRRRALIILSGGGGERLAAVEDPHETLYEMDASGRSVLHRFPSARSGAMGVKAWRDLMIKLNQAGFDVLAYDRRGVGMSSGFSDTNTLQQGRDLLSVTRALATGEGVRVLPPSGKTLAGAQATRALLGGEDGGRLPVLLLGNSRGTMATGWAMQRNFDKTCDFDLSPQASCGPPVGLKNIVGAIQYADFTAGPGYQSDDTTQDDRERQLFMGATVERYNIVFFPSSAVLASVPKWPALFIGRGLFDYAESLEGSVAVYDRVRGLKELAVTRAPHPFEVWPAAERERIVRRTIAFATAAALGRSGLPGARPWHDLRSLVATAGEAWESSSQPKP